MKLHLPVILRRSVLSCIAGVALSSMGSGVALADNLIFDGSTLTWNTENKVFQNEEDEYVAFVSGDNVTFKSDASVFLEQDIMVGKMSIGGDADVVIDPGSYMLDYSTLSLLGGSLDMGSSLRIAAGDTLAVGANGSVIKSALVLDTGATLCVDFAGNGSTATSLNSSPLLMSHRCLLQLENCGAGDGKTYTILSGVSGLANLDGNAITLDSTNNAISNYFDVTRPGTGFWENATLQLIDGNLQLVLHSEDVKDTVASNDRERYGADYQYYEGVEFKNIKHHYTSSYEHICGGAVYGGDNSNIALNNNGEVLFSENSVSRTPSNHQYDVYGGAIYGGNNSNITLNNNGSIEFYRNEAVYDPSSSIISEGGAIYGSEYSNIMLNSNGSVLFTGNSASSGGAISAGEYSNITMNCNERVLFIGNTASSAGGAIFGGPNSITISYNGNVLFRDNAARHGGAIWVQGTDLTISNNGSVLFVENSASSFGGAITDSYYYSNNTIINNNDIVVFDGNTAFCGGAIYAERKGISIDNNGSVSFIGNTAFRTGDEHAYGGALYSYQPVNLCIQNNDSVEFYQNVEVNNESFRLRSVYVIAGPEGISLSAAEQKNITFRDSVYIGGGYALELNADYTDVMGNAIKQKGDVLFTGATTENDLYIVKGNVAGTPEEVLASRTTEVNTMTNLYGGRLRVEDGAIYKGYGITAHANSDSTVLVKDAVLSHVGKELHFFEGTKLETLGESEIFGDVIVESTATVAFSTLTRLEGSLTLVSGSELCLAGELTLDGALRLGMGLTLSGDVLEMVNQLQAGQSLTLMVGLDSLVVQTADLLRSDIYTDVLSGQCLQASNYFSNLEADSGLVLVYDGAVGSLSISNGNVIPEPATTTLSLLALSALVGCRRRKV